MSSNVPAIPIFNNTATLDDREDDILANKIIHVRTQQRSGRKCITIIENIPDEYDMKRIVKALRKVYACNGACNTHKVYGDVITLQGDKRIEVREFFSKVGLAKLENIKIH